MTVPTPECDKALAVQEDAQKIGAFLDWIEAQGYFLCYYVSDFKEGYRRNVAPFRTIIADYFGVDLDKVDQEQRTLLKSLNKIK